MGEVVVSYARSVSLAKLVTGTMRGLGYTCARRRFPAHAATEVIERG